MIKFIFFVFSTIGLSVANAANFVIAKISFNESFKITKKISSQLGKLESEGKILINESDDGFEIVYSQHSASDLYAELKEAGVVVDRITVSSQKTGGGCGDTSMRGSGAKKE